MIAKRNVVVLLVVPFAFASLPVALAEETPETPPSAPSTAASASSIPDVQLEGLVDVYGSIPTRGDPRAQSAFRVFDASNGSSNLAYLELAVSRAPEPAGFRLDVGFGPVAEATTLEVVGSPQPANDVYKNVQQAFVSFAIPSCSAVIDAGRFVTTAGAEVIEAKDGWAYSRSLLFGYAIPFTHTGIRGTARLGSAVTVQASLVNGWDVVQDGNRYKTGGLSATVAAPTGTTLVVTGYAGPEGSSGETADWRRLLDVVISQTAGKRVSLSLNADVGSESEREWYGVAAMARVAVADRLALSIRGEHFDDPHGIRTGVLDIDGNPAGLWIREVTATVALPVPETDVELRLEARHDWAEIPVFDAGRSSDQTTLQAAFLAHF